MARTPPFQGGEAGSKPVWSTKQSGDWRNWERSSFASFSQEFESPIFHQNKMKIKFIKTHWFRGVPVMWNTLHTSQNKTAKIFRFGPLLIRVEK